MHRRDFLLTIPAAPAILHAWQERPTDVAGIQSGDIVPGRAMVWAKSARPGRMTVTWKVSGKSHRVEGPEVSAATDFTGRVDLVRLPPGQRILYEVRFTEGKQMSPAMQGELWTPPVTRSNVRFLWSGDTVGQGYGINPDIGGMRIYGAMRNREPHFFIHSGDTIYADGPVPREIRLPDGRIWKNIVTEAKSKPAETLDEFRGCYRYNWLDTNFQRFGAAVPQIWQWDDHELMNNWSPSRDLSARQEYREKNLNVLVERARQAFLEYAPIRGRSIYRHIPYGPLLDVFVVDLRSYRGPNNYNLQADQTPDTAYFGAAQLQWLKRGLASSKAVWKVIASDMPIGLIVGDGKDAQGRNIFENSANGDGPPLGRELEIAAILRFIKQRKIRNTVWLTADVHYTAAHYYDPAKAQIHDFDGFWEFVSGPLNAGTFGPGKLDNTFGPQVMFQKAPPPGKSNLPPSDGYQFFGEVEIDGKDASCKVTLRDMAGDAIYSKVLPSEQT